MGLARPSPQLLPSSFSSGLTRCSVSTFVPAALLLWGWERLTGWVRVAVSHPAPLPDTRLCSSGTGDLSEGRRWKEVKSVHDGFGGHTEEGACSPANMDLAKCSHCLCPVALPWSEAVAAQEPCCSCGLPHVHPSTLSVPPTSLSAKPFTSTLTPLATAGERA